MKRFLCGLVLILPIFALGQITENFDSNSWGWTEYSGTKGDAVIMNGVLHLESRNDKINNVQDIIGGIFSMAYAPIDPQKGFKLTCEAIINKIDYDKRFGIVLDYKDDWNCIILLITRDNAYFYRIREGRVVNLIHRQFKLGKQKKDSIDNSLKYIDNTLELRVNDINAYSTALRNISIDTNGIGFFAYGYVNVDFDNVTVSDAY